MARPSLERAAMRMLRTLVDAAVPLGIVISALLNARAVSALVAWVDADTVGLAVAREGARSHAEQPPKSADAILDRNPFDHETGPLRGPLGAMEPPSWPAAGGVLAAPLCDGVRPLVLVGDEDQSVAFASLEIGGQRVLRRRGGDAGGRRVVYVGRDRVWLEGAGGLCQALLFGAHPPQTDRHSMVPDPRTPLEAEIGNHIVKTALGEYSIDRPTLERILELQSDLRHPKMVPEKEGDRLVGVRVFGIEPGSVLSRLGIENGDRLETVNGFEVANPERALAAYARLRLADHLTVRLTRAGKAMSLDYDIR